MNDKVQVFVTEQAGNTKTGLEMISVFRECSKIVELHHMDQQAEKINGRFPQKAETMLDAVNTSDLAPSNHILIGFDINSGEISQAGKKSGMMVYNVNEISADVVLENIHSSGPII